MAYDSEGIALLLEQVEDEGSPTIFMNAGEALAAGVNLPDAWVAALRGAKESPAAVRELWSGLVEKLPRTIKMLERKVVGFGVLATDAHPACLLYFLDTGRDLMAQRGFPPTEKLPANAKKLSVDLSLLYRLHDGWVNIFDQEGGHLPVERWTVIGRSRGIKGCLSVFSNGSQSLGFDLDHTPAPACSLDTDEEEVEVLDDFWMELDDSYVAILKSYADAS